MESSVKNASVPSRPDIVNIGAILTFDSIIGKVGKIALEAVVENVNSDPTILNGTKLKITIHDSNFSGFASIMEGTNILTNEEVAIKLMIIIHTPGTNVILQRQRWLTEEFVLRAYLLLFLLRNYVKSTTLQTGEFRFVF